MDRKGRQTKCMCGGRRVLFQLLNNRDSQPADEHPEWKKGKKDHQSKGPFPNPHKLHLTSLQWDDYTLLARILWRLLTEPHYIGSHLWLNVSASCLPACTCDLPLPRLEAGGGVLVFSWQFSSQVQGFFLLFTKTAMQKAAELRSHDAPPSLARWALF